MSISKEREAKAKADLEGLYTRVARVFSLKDKGYSHRKIAEELNVSEGDVRTLLNASDEVRTQAMANLENALAENDDKEMVLFDRYVTEPEKLAITKEFVGNMTDANFERYKVLPFERKAYLLRLYAQKHHNTDLSIDH